MFNLIQLSFYYDDDDDGGDYDEDDDQVPTSSTTIMIARIIPLLPLYVTILADSVCFSLQVVCRKRSNSSN